MKVTIASFFCSTDLEGASAAWKATDTERSLRRVVHIAHLVIKGGGVGADSDRVNTIAAPLGRVPRPVVIAVVALAAAFVALPLIRVGVLGGSSDSTSATPVAPRPLDIDRGYRHQARRDQAQGRSPARPSPHVAHALRYSKVAVVSLYVGQAQSDRAVVTEVRKGARSVGAGFVASTSATTSRRQASHRSPAQCRLRRCWSSDAPARSWPSSLARSKAPWLRRLLTTPARVVEQG